MAKVRTKQFTITEAYQLGLVDRWWAGLLHAGLKELVKVEWEALGEMMWLLRVHWQPVSGDRINVGHPRYADISTESLEEGLQDALSEFEGAYQDFTHIGIKVQDWGLSEEAPTEEDPYRKLLFRDSLDEAEKIIAIEFLWPHYLRLQKHLTYLTTHMTELDREIKARVEPDYYRIEVDRGMLRAAFLDQVGYDNDWLFQGSNGPQPQVEE